MKAGIDQKSSQGTQPGFIGPVSEFGREFSRCEDAGTMTTTALLLPVLFGFAALAIDGSMLFMHRRQLQTIADSGALYGAHETIIDTEYTDEGLTTMVANNAEESGYDTITDSIMVATPPTSGDYTATDPGKAVEVVVTRDVPFIFAGIFLENQFQAAARAVAAGVAITTGSGCLISLDDSERGAMTFGGNGRINVPCGVHSNSSDARGIVASGSTVVGVTGVSSVGGIRTNGGAEFEWWDTDDEDSSIAWNPDADPIEDPLKSFQEQIPTIAEDGSDCDITGGFSVGPSDTTRLPPAALTASYNPGLIICGDLDVQGTLLVIPGTYYITGSIKVTSDAVIGLDRDDNGVVDDLSDRDTSSDGVTFVLTNEVPSETGQLDIQGTPTIQLTAPATDSGSPYAGILFMQDDDAVEHASIKNQINGDSDSVFDGAIYFPTTEMVVNGGAVAENTCTMIVSDTMTINGGANINSDASRCEDLGLNIAGFGVAINRVQLVE